jgi:hypothetical protein
MLNQFSKKLLARIVLGVFLAQGITITPEVTVAQ